MKISFVDEGCELTPERMRLNGVGQPVIFMVGGKLVKSRASTLVNTRIECCNIAVLRDRNLVSFSHQHQHALALCVRIKRALDSTDVDLRAWQEEIASMFDTELELHFESEERFIFPKASTITGLRELLERLNADHTRLRIQAMEARQKQLDREGLAHFAAVLEEHVRAEERVLFEQMQESLSAEELQKIGTATDIFLKERASR
jgi:hemerythrin-like domain-containing protein